jgi:tRNA pseudouridine38-40 synthase
MVRVIAGTLMETGRGRIDPEQMAEILRKKDRRAAGPTAAAHGLMLVGVQYET